MIGTFNPFRGLGLWELILLGVDILLVAFVFYQGTMLIRGTRAVQLLKGFFILLLASVMSEWLHLYTFSWLLNKAWGVLSVAVPVVFQPELRRALEQLGRGHFLSRTGTLIAPDEATVKVIGDIVRAVQVLEKNKIGALVVIEKETGIQDRVETGVALDGLVSAELLVNLFIPNTPLHDGAVIIRGNRVAAAGCYLPLTDNPDVGKELGTRHRAAIGIAEQSDAVAVVVSEETGTVSVAHEGVLYRYLDDKSLRETLEKFLVKEGAPVKSFWNWRS